MLKTIVLAGGCFWGVQQYMALVPGVVATETGYANGHTENPTYKQVCALDTGYAEAVKVTYKDNEITLDQLLRKYYEIIDPTALNRQGNDVGSQYRTGVYYTDSEDEAVIKASLQALQASYTAPLAVEAQKLTTYYPAEDYHQNYLVKNPGGYCHIPKFKFAQAYKKPQDN